MKRQRKRVDGKLIYVYKLDRDLLCDRAPLRGSAEADRGIILEAIARRYQMALIENSPNKPSAVPSVSTNIETEAQIEHLELELDGNSAVLPVDHNIDAKGQIEHPDLELDDQSAVLRVPNNIETKALLGHHLLEVELQTSGASAANYIDDDEQGEPSEMSAGLMFTLGQNI
ncbi:MAG: hypothetical protein QNJ54_36470 [Prochloraceae cyanobacterium]|nr:hypothetical protein [Prochloraceae cyanobacterium]